jgi:hypothetical protein
VREKLGYAAFAVVLIAVWGVGFLWFRGDLSFSAEQASAGKAAGTAAGKTGDQAGSRATTSTSASPSPSATPSTDDGKALRGTIKAGQELRPVDIIPSRPRPRPIALPPVAQFTMATFNLLGSSHTRQSGKDPGKASGPQRLGGALQVLDQHKVTVVGLQEFQTDQRRAFQSRAQGWQMYPGLTMRGGDGENSIAWRTSVWELVKPATVSIPYFRGNARQMPSVLLRNKQTGVQAYFSNFHNPADTKTFRNQGRFRQAATAREIALINTLAKTGVPQFVTGDMNMRDEYFCRVTGATGLVAAAGGSNKNGSCQVPRPTQIDWIFGSPGVVFSNYTIDRSALVRRTTDHPIVVSQVSVDALKFKNSFDPSYVPTTP